MTGIIDWEDKRKALHAIFGEKQQKPLIRKILGDAHDEAAVQSTVRMFKKWGQHDPDKHVGDRFMAELAQRITEYGSTKSKEEIKSTILEGRFSMFFELFPEGIRSRVILKPRTRKTHDGLHAIWVLRSKEDKFPDILDINAKKPFDQKHHYESANAAKHWEEITKNQGDYRLFNECKTTLASLYQEPCWKGFFADGKADGIVMLGAGAPAKELATIDSMLENIPPTVSEVSFALVDYSHAMLKMSQHAMYKAHQQGRSIKWPVGRGRLRDSRNSRRRA